MNAGAAFTVYPAIDLRAGRVVRLQQGDPLRETGYSGTPLQIAQQWLAAGAAWLHVVNLDGAFGEDGAANALALASILRSGARVQFGGGLRTLLAIEQALQLGVERVVLGTVAATEPALVAAPSSPNAPSKLTTCSHAAPAASHCCAICSGVPL
ncbi:MAG: 1-(5-phosphoribosyl)-5-[(5-phosphoribosylamino)methylideneamino] imidazole-4-carboxamide isomerase [Chloroflexota bacterium]